MILGKWELPPYAMLAPMAGVSDRALRELAALNQEVAVGLLAVMQPKKAARHMDQLAILDAKLAGRLSERVGITRPKAQ